MGVFKRWIANKDGKQNAFWYIRYALNGKMKWESVGRVGPYTKDVARARLEERKRQVRLGQFDMIGVEVPTLPDFAKDYLSYVRDVKKKKSWKKDEVTLRHLNIFFGNKKLSNISPKDIDDYKGHMIKNGYKAGSINRELACLKYLYNLAIRWKKYIGLNPATQVEFLHEGEGSKRILSPEEEFRLLRVSPQYLQNIIIVALNTGMTKMEILSLKWEYVDFEKQMITLPQTNTKAKKTRNIPISSALHKTLLEQKLKSGGSEYVFPSDDPNKGHLTWIKHSFSTACKRAGIEGLRFHDLRHTAATRMLESGVDIANVSKILGHSDINLTMKTYYHPEKSLKEAVEKLANFNQSYDQNRVQITTIND